MTFPHAKLLIPVSLIASLAACGGTGTRSPGAMAQAYDATPKPIEAADAGTEAGFQNWVRNFRSRALAAGISGPTYDSAMATARFNPEVIRLDRRQSEFTKPVWEYLDSAVSENRIATGRQMLSRHGGTLAAIESRYGVPREIVLAVWGMESNFGSNRGRTMIIPALATLAYDGRRASFFEEQLIAALRIIQSGDVDSRHMLGSWAGAMGHTQFMPTSFLTHAVDFNGDGRRDIWSDDPTDSLASTASYLARSGWVRGETWGREVVLPAGFNYGLAGKNRNRSGGEWSGMGVRAVDGGAVPSGWVLAPAGARGPAFVVTRNFSAILRYNNSNSYGLGVSILGDRIAGRPGIRGNWPRQDSPLSNSQKEEIQRRLTALGFDTGGIDGKLGSQSIEAIKAYQASRGMVPDGYANSELLASLR